MSNNTNYPFGGGSTVPGGNVQVGDIHPLVIKHGDSVVGTYTPLTAPETEIDIPDTQSHTLYLQFDNPTGDDTVLSFTPSEDAVIPVGSLRLLGGSGARQTYQPWGPICNNGTFKVPYVWHIADGELDDNDDYRDLYQWVVACVSQGGTDFSILYEKDWYDLVDIQHSGNPQFVSLIDFRKRDCAGGLQITASALVDPVITGTWYTV